MLRRYFGVLCTRVLRLQIFIETTVNDGKKSVEKNQNQANRIERSFVTDSPLHKQFLRVEQRDMVSFHKISISDVQQWVSRWKKSLVYDFCFKLRACTLIGIPAGGFRVANCRFTGVAELSDIQNAAASQEAINNLRDEQP